MNDRKKPHPEQVQREFEKLIRQRFSGSLQHFTSALAAEFRAPAAADPSLTFSLKPKEVKAYLDRYVISQDEAKKTLAIAICDHYKQVQAKAGGEDEEYVKPNVLLLGPTGVGKTYLVRKLAQLIGVPFIKADATKFSETGYVGAKVEDMLRDLLSQAGGNRQRAACGIIYLDEIDKLASNGRGKEVNTRGVQFALLKLMEETEVDLRSGQDLHSQLQTIMDDDRGQSRSHSLNTKHILFIGSGAFHGLEDIIQRRLGSSAIGFARDQSTAQRRASRGELLSEASLQDFIQYGFEPEFIGRLPIRAALHGLDSADFYRILTQSEGSIIRQYQRTFRAYDIELSFSDEALQLLATRAAMEASGARTLLTLCERALRPFKFELPSTSLQKLHVTSELIADPEAYLQKILGLGAT